MQSIRGTSFDEQSGQAAWLRATNCRRAPRRRRAAVSPAKFKEVAVRQGSFCFWCGIKVVRESQIPSRNRYLKENGRLVYLSSDGELREAAVGTVDHLVARGGRRRHTGWRIW